MFPEFSGIRVNWLCKSFFFCPVCPSPRLRLPIITRKTSFFFKAGILCHQSCLIPSYRSLIKLHILSLGSILTTKYRLKYLCVSIWQREQRRYLYWNCIALDRFLPPPAGIDRAWGGSWIASATAWLGCSITGVWECHLLPWNTGNIRFNFVFLIWKMCILRGSGNCWRRITIPLC